ncbi:m7GpppN-mRNA hydrolase NUDT17-like [Glandiceps talaboti]
MAANPITRVLVHLRKGSESQSHRAKFTQSVSDLFTGCHGEIGEVGCELKDNKLLISDVGGDRVFLKRASFCPVHHLKVEDIPSIPEDTLQRGIDVGVSTLIRTQDRRILLTRRASHLRIFPGVWVPPGGHVELNENIIEAGLRELHEETGLHLNPQECPGQITALWESVYPPYLSRGLPRRHHIVVYVTIDVKENHDVLDQRIKIDPNEVGASAWLDETLVKAIIASDEDGSEDEIPTDLPEYFRAKVVNSAREQIDTDLKTCVLLKQAPAVLTGDDIERVSTGTKFALNMLMKKMLPR